MSEERERMADEDPGRLAEDEGDEVEAHRLAEDDKGRLAEDGERERFPED